MSELLSDGQRLLVGGPRSDRIAGFGEHNSDTHVGPCQVELELGDVGIGIAQLLLDGDRSLVLCNCPCGIARPGIQKANAVEGGRQVSPDILVERVSIGEFLTNLRAPCRRQPAPPPSLPFPPAHCR